MIIDVALTAQKQDVLLPEIDTNIEGCGVDAMPFTTLANRSVREKCISTSFFPR